MTVQNSLLAALEAKKIRSVLPLLLQKKLNFVVSSTAAKKQRLIENCRAMLAPSVWWEALGLVTYEAYDCRKPMLASASGGLTETISDGVTGFLHERGSAVGLAESVKKLESMDPAARRSMGEAGNRWLLEEASKEQWQNRFTEIVSTAVS